MLKPYHISEVSDLERAVRRRALAEGLFYGVCIGIAATCLFGTIAIKAILGGGH